LASPGKTRDGRRTGHGVRTFFAGGLQCLRGGTALEVASGRLNPLITILRCKGSGVFESGVRGMPVRTPGWLRLILLDPRDGS
jgi:hypothetical protein